MLEATRDIVFFCAANTSDYFFFFSFIASVFPPDTDCRVFLEILFRVLEKKTPAVKKNLS